VRGALMPDAPLTPEIVDFVESGVSTLVGTRDANLRPHGVRAMGAIVSSDRRRVTVFLPTVTSARALADLRDNGAIAITFSRPSDHQGIQLKGRVVGTRPATDEDRFVQERYRAAWFEQLHMIGVPRATSKRWAHWPAIAVELEVDALFLQTPGPGAGEAIDSKGESAGVLPARRPIAR